MRRFRKVLAVAVLLVPVPVAFGVVIQQYSAWVSADLDRNVEEFGPRDSLDSCMGELDGVWLPWLVAEGRDMCSEATDGD